MTSGTDLLNRYKQGILVAIDRNVLDMLGVTACLTLDPEFLPGATPVRTEARVHCFLQRFPVHPGHHQHLPIIAILDDGWDQAVGIVSQVIEGRHGSSLPGYLHGQ